MRLHSNTYQLLLTKRAPPMQAYYYAHAKKNTGEPPAPPPVHVPLHKAASTNELRRETISTYSFSNDSTVVKLYVPLEGVGQLDEASISAHFEERSFEVLVRGYGGDANRVLVLGAKRLHGDIEPSKCSHKRLANKVVVTLAKKAGAEDGHCSRWQWLTP